MANAITSGNPAAWPLLMLSSSLLLGIFLHSSFSQILGNLIFLWVFGKSIEDILGHGRFLVFYLLSGILTGVVQILAEPTLTMPLIGANGAIVLGAYLLSFPKAKKFWFCCWLYYPHRVASTILSILVVCATDVLWDWQFKHCWWIQLAYLLGAWGWFSNWCSLVRLCHRGWRRTEQITSGFGTSLRLKLQPLLKASDW